MIPRLELGHGEFDALSSVVFGKFLRRICCFLINNIRQYLFTFASIPFNLFLLEERIESIVWIFAFEKHP